jgi:hypothetical protein
MATPLRRKLKIFSCLLKFKRKKTQATHACNTHPHVHTQHPHVHTPMHTQHAHVHTRMHTQHTHATTHTHSTAHTHACEKKKRAKEGNLFKSSFFGAGVVVSAKHISSAPKGESSSTVELQIGGVAAPELVWWSRSPPKHALRSRNPHPCT